MESSPPYESTVYGPVHSWRVGNSLGIDLLYQTSICSFNCVYCQLGHIQRITARQDIYVPTEKVIQDLKAVDWAKVDIVTFSGNGEPTLALNLGDVVDHIKDTQDKPVMVLTNATMLHDEATRQRLRRVDTVACKLDAASEDVLRRFNRPAAEVSLESILKGIRALRNSDYPGKVAVQCMFMPMNRGDARILADLLASIEPHEIHLNTPKRPYPREWYRESRGNHEKPAPVEEVSLKTVTLEEAEEIERIIREKNPASRILSVYRSAPKA